MTMTVEYARGAIDTCAAIQRVCKAAVKPDLGTPEVQHANEILRALIAMCESIAKEQRENKALLEVMQCNPFPTL